MMQDLILACGASEADETYRLAIEAALTLPRPLSVTITRKGHSITITGKRFQRDSRRPYAITDLHPTWPVVQSAKRTVSETEWRDWIDDVRASGFWSARTDLNEVYLGNDGETWLIEGRLGRLYHFAGQRDLTPNLKNLAEHLATLAGMMPIREEYP